MKLNIPLSVTIPRKTKEDKKIMLNLNVYRNLHHITNNNMKIIYKDLVAGLVGSQTLGKPPYKLTYTLYQQSGRATDVANALCIVDKFVCDSLVSIGTLPDDNHKIIRAVEYRYGGVDKENPRAELEITCV